MSLLPYPEYKQNRLAWRVPAHWLVTRLNAMSTSPRKTLTPTELQDHQVFHYSIPQVQASGTGKVEQGSSIESSKLLISEKCVLVSKLNPRKASNCTAEPQSILTVASGEFVPLVPTSQLEHDYLFYLVDSDEFRTGLMARVESATRSHQRVQPADISKCLWAFPTLSEQLGIARFLNQELEKIDHSVSKQEQMIELLKEKQYASIWKIVTKGLDAGGPTCATNIRWIGEVPSHWTTVPIRKVARLESGHTPSKSKPEYWVEAECTIPWFTLTDINQVRDGIAIYVTDTENKISPLGIANSSARLLPTNTVFLSRTASVGFSGIMSEEMAVSQDFAAWICGDRLLPEYLLLCLRAMKPDFDRLMMGSTHKTIYMPDIEKLVIPLPPVEEQQAIVDHVFEFKRKSERLIDRAETNIKLLQERRSALISAAVTGKIDVRSYHQNTNRDAA